MEEHARASLSKPEVIAAALAIGLIAPLGPGAWFVYSIAARGIIVGDGLTPMRAGVLASMPTESFVLGLATLALLAFVPRLVLTTASMQAARGRPVAPLSLLREVAGRVIRGRRVSLVVATCTFGFGAYLVWTASTRIDHPAAPIVGSFLVALLIAAGIGMASSTDRAAAFDVDGTSDARAAQLREEGRFAGPHYLDTSSARRGYDVATSADDATTVGMLAFLGARAWLAALASLVADALPVVLGTFVPEFTGLSALWLTPTGAPIGVVEVLATVAFVLLRAGLEVGIATMWTHVYHRRS